MRALGLPVTIWAWRNSVFPPVPRACGTRERRMSGDTWELLRRLGPDPCSVLILPHAAAPAALRGIRRIYAQAAAAAAADHASQSSGPGSLPANPRLAEPPPQQPLRMRLLHLPLHGAGASPGPSPAIMLELLQLLQPRHLLLSSRDHELLQQAALMRQQQHLLQLPPQPQPQGGSAALPPHVPAPAIQLARESVVPYGWLSQVAVSLPRNVHSALISPDLLARLQWLGAGPGLQVRAVWEQHQVPSRFVSCVPYQPAACRLV